jgi:hypothetical protein
VPNVPAGRYLVRGTVDLNGNRAADPREAFDTVRAAADAPRAAARADTTPGAAIYAFLRDTLAPRITTVAAGDSVTLRVTFDRPLRPDQPFAQRLRVLGADSAAVAVRSVLSAAAADSLTQGRGGRRATAARAIRSARADAGPARPRPARNPRAPPACRVRRSTRHGRREFARPAPRSSPPAPRPPPSAARSRPPSSSCGLRPPSARAPPTVCERRR